MVSKIKKNEFVFDPENGGGRRRRIKKVSRMEMIEGLKFDKSSRQEEQEEWNDPD